MAIKKEGDLRVMKGAALYGPMTRLDLERLLDRGKLEPTDRVSVLDGSWMAIGDYLAQGHRQAEPAIVPEPPALAAKPSTKAGDLRLLKGNKVFSSLSREHIADLRVKGRVGDDDLVCAFHGPWMRLGDFLAPPARAGAPVDLPASHEEPLARAELVAEPAEVVEPYEGGDPDDLEVLNVEGGYRVDDLLAPATQLSDEWFVRVRGIHSAPLKKQHVRMLYEAREIAFDCPARHVSWRTELWVPLYAVPDLADIAGP